MLSVINVGVVGRCSVCAPVFLFSATLCKVAQIQPSGQEPPFPCAQCVCELLRTAFLTAT